MSDSSGLRSEQHSDISKSDGFLFPETEKQFCFATGSFN